MVSLSLIVLKTKQEESLRDFYGTLGIEFQTEQHGTGPTHHAGELGDLIMEIYPLNENAMTDQQLDWDLLSKISDKLWNFSKI